MLNEKLLAILVCPETRQDLSVAESSLVEKVNSLIREGRLTTRAGEKVSQPIDSGLVRADRKVLYPVRQGIPILLMDEGILLPS